MGWLGDRKGEFAGMMTDATQAGNAAARGIGRREPRVAGRGPAIDPQGKFCVELFSIGDLWALVEVVLVNLVLSVDNAIVVGMAVAGLPAARRLRVMTIGIGGATLLRILFAAFTVQLLRVTGLVLVGGL